MSQSNVEKRIAFTMIRSGETIKFHIIGFPFAIISTINTVLSCGETTFIVLDTDTDGVQVRCILPWYAYRTNIHDGYFIIDIMLF